ARTRTCDKVFGLLLNPSVPRMIDRISRSPFGVPAASFCTGLLGKAQQKPGQARSSLSRFRDWLPSRHGRPARHLASGFMAPEWHEHAGRYGAPQDDLARRPASGPAWRSNVEERRGPGVPFWVGARSQEAAGGAVGGPERAVRIPPRRRAHQL